MGQEKKKKKKKVPSEQGLGTYFLSSCPVGWAASIYSSKVKKIGLFVGLPSGFTSKNFPVNFCAFEDSPLQAGNVIFLKSPQESPGIQ